ncbi:hypothetical protein JXR93_13680 [bacterium]|nr:hypothetical protein [bacterium]
MIRRILVNILFVSLFIGCDSDSVEYEPKLVLVREPQQTESCALRTEWVISDILARKGSTKLSIVDVSGSALITENRDNVWFKSTGSIFSFCSVENINTPFVLRFEICLDEDNSCFTENFSVEQILPLNTESTSKIYGEIVNPDEVSVEIKLKKQALNGFFFDNFELSNIQKGRDTLFIKASSKDSDYFYRDIEIDDFLFDSTSKLKIFIPKESYENYEEEIIPSCTFSGKYNPALPLITIALILFLLFIRKKDEE